LPAGPFALILGNEGNGIRETVSDASDIQVKIHMTNTESLNVAVAGSICMYLLKGN
jgi:TrmH family RNA methyltransferase